MFPEWLKIQTDSVQFFWVMWSHWNTLLRAKPLCTHLALPMKSSIWGHSTYKLKHIPGDSGFCLQTYCSERLWCFGCVVLSERAEILDVFRLQRRRQTLDGVDDVMLAPIRHHQQLIPAQQTTSYFDYYHFFVHVASFNKYCRNFVDWCMLFSIFYSLSIQSGYKQKHSFNTVDCSLAVSS